MKYIEPDEEYLEQAYELVLKKYESESTKNKNLPKINSSDLALCKTKLLDVLKYFFSLKKGTLAITEKGTLAGFIFFPWSEMDGFFGECKGAFSPLAGNAFCDTSDEADGLTQKRVACILLQNEMQRVVKQGNTSFAIMLNASDKEIIEAYNLYGFGIRCADAIKKVSEKDKFTGSSEDSNLSYKSFTIDEITKPQNVNRFQEIYELRKKLEEHLCASPCFFPSCPLTIEEFEKEERDRNTTYNVACEKDSKIVGYITTFKGGENWISENLCEDGKMIHICGTYVNEKYRGAFADESGKKTSVAEQILFFIERNLREEKIEYLGVDCETLNPTALNFWGKYFANYTYSMHRRIDERCLR